MLRVRFAHAPPAETGITSRLSRGHIPKPNHSLWLLTLLVTLISFDSAWAQDHLNSTHREKLLGPCLTLGIASYREDLIVPLAFSGPDISIGGIFTRNNAKHRVHVRLNLGLGHLENRYSHEAWVLSLDARFSWVRMLTGHQRYGEFWGGICVPVQMNNLFFESWDDAHLYWLTAYTAGAAVLWTKNISARNTVHIQMEVPLFGLISRPPTYRYAKQEPLNHWTYHFSEPNRDLRFETLDTYRSLYLQIVLNRKVGGSFLAVGYEFEFDHCERPEDIRRMTNSIFVSYLWSVGR